MRAVGAFLAAWVLSAVMGLEAGRLYRTPSPSTAPKPPAWDASTPSDRTPEDVVDDPATARR